MLALTFDATVDLRRSDARHGVGCFETVRVQAGAARWLGLHRERLAAGCAALGLPAPPPEQALAAFLAAALSRLGDGALHLVAVDGALRASLSAPPPPPALPVRVAVAESVTRFSRSPTAGLKTLSFLENRLLQAEAERRGLFDVVARNERGLLADGGRTNLFLVVGGRVLTPPVSDGALPGIARRVLLEQGLAAEESLDPAALEAAEGVFLANALRGVLPVRLDAGGRAAACGAALR
jgi:branched-chain amino acid aminotransferase